MPEVVDQFRRRATSTLAEFTTGQKVVSGFALVALVVGAVLFSNWAGKPTYSMLFSNLDPKDAASITTKLSTDHVSYKLTDGGLTILVPQSSVYSERIKMSAAGLPSGGTTGYALLDKQGITTSQFIQQVDYQRALEGELAKTISSIDGVSAANVHLVIPPNDVFADSTQKPSASVLILNTPGKSLDPGQVQAVVHLVASSVASLDPTEVTVADSKGTTLWAPGQDGTTAAITDARQQQTASYQDNVASSIQNMLASVIGPNHAVVRVTADLNFDQINSTTDSYGSAANPTKPVPVLNQTTTKEVYSGSAAANAAGPLSANPVIPTTTTTLAPGTTAAANAGPAYAKDAAATNYGVDKTTQVVTQAPGSVKRLSVAVAVDSKTPNVNPQQLQALVSAAAGINPTRGDVVTVTALPFDTTAATQATKALKAAASANSMTTYIDLGKTVLLVGVLLLVLLVLIRASRRAPQRLPLAVGPDLSLQPGASGYADIAVGAPAALAAMNNAPMLASPAVSALIDSQPDQVAELLRGWLADRRS